jgi:EH_Signature domain
MTWDGLLRSVEERAAMTHAEMRSGTSSAQDAFRSLRVVLREIDRGDSAREVVAYQKIDIDEVRWKIAEERWDDLARSEVRAVTVMFREFSPPRLDGFLGHFPHRWSSYLRSLVRQWSMAMLSSDWNPYAALTAKAPPDAWQIYPVPVERRVLLTREGPERLAQAQVGAGPLSELSESLERARIPTWSELYGAILLAYLVRKQRAGLDVSEDVRWLMSDAGARSLLMPTRSEGSDAHVASEEMKASCVSSLLGCRMKNLIADDSFESVETHLLAQDSFFGDPRIQSNLSWDLVRRKNETAYAAFLESLIREDLSFFFEHAMREPSRGRFWLRYLGSLRRTTCVLDPASRQRIATTRALLPKELKAAFERTLRFEGGEVSAFCLWFDQFVVVEFSKGGHALYVYPKEIFDKRFPRVSRLFDTGSLKWREEAERWVHRGSWEFKFDASLRKRGVRPDPPSRSGVWSVR